MNQIRGVFPVFQLPFHEDLSIDWNVLGKEIDWLIDQRVDGIAMAMVSELLRLSSEERDQVAEFVLHRIAGRTRCIISVGAESVHTAMRHARHAAACGCDAVMAIPPVSIAIDDAERKSYYLSILAAADVPLIIQDASGYVGRPMSIPFQVEMLHDAGADRIWFKPEAEPIVERIQELSTATGGEAVIFEGSGGIHLHRSFHAGIAATMPGAEIADAIRRLWLALEGHESETVARLSHLIGRLVELQSSLDSFLAVEKHILLKRGIFHSTAVRGPVGYRLSDEMRSTIDVRLGELLQAMEELD